MSVTNTLFKVFKVFKTDRLPFLEPDCSSGIKCDSSARRITYLPIFLLFMLKAAEKNCIVRVPSTSYTPDFFQNLEVCDLFITIWCESFYPVERYICPDYQL